MSEINSRVMAHVDQALAGLQNELEFVGMQDDANQVYAIRQQLKTGEIDRQHNEIIHLQTQLKQAQQAVEAARVEEMEKCCRDICRYCNEYSEGAEDMYIRLLNGEWVHGSDPRNGGSESDYYGGYAYCQADAIRQRWAREQTAPPPQPL